MSDSIADRIAAIIKEHQFRVDINGSPDQVFYCECQYMRGDTEGWMLQMAAKEHPAHVAQVIVGTLGLRKQVGVGDLDGGQPDGWYYADEIVRPEGLDEQAAGPGRAVFTSYVTKWEAE